MDEQEQQELREMEVLIVSAEGLKNVKHVSKLRPYAVAYVDKERHAARTRVDEDGETGPTWNEIVTVKFRCDLPASDAAAALTVEVYADGHLAQKHVGAARVLLSDVLRDDAAEDDQGRVMSVQIRRRSGRPQGVLYLWVPPSGKFSFRDSAAEKVMVMGGVGGGEEGKDM